MKRSVSKNKKEGAPKIPLALARGIFGAYDDDIESRNAF